MSPSGDITAEVIYANYGTPEDFEKLDKLKIDVHGKIVLVRYGQNFRGVKVFVAQEHGAAGVIIYSDPADDGWWEVDGLGRWWWRLTTLPWCRPEAIAASLRKILASRSKISACCPLR